MNDSEESECYCSVYETLTRCRFFAVGQQSACRGFSLAKWARRCTYWHRLDDNTYRCGNPDSQSWAAARYNEKKAEKGGEDGGRAE
jgi:hypothetical protein